MQNMDVLSNSEGIVNWRLAFECLSDLSVIPCGARSSLRRVLGRYEVFGVGVINNEKRPLTVTPETIWSLY